MSIILNISDDFIKKVVSCINSAVTDDIIQDTRQANMNRSTMNSYSFRIWDLINRNVCNTFNGDPNVVVGFTKRGIWNFTPIFDKKTSMLFTLMREERFRAVKYDKRNREHYVYELARIFNVDLEPQQQSFFELDSNLEKTKGSVRRVCNDLLISTEMVKHHAIVLFSSHDGLLNSVRFCMINCNFEECETMSWNDYIGVSESIVVEQTTNDDHKQNNPTMGLSYTPKAKKKKQLNLDIVAKNDSDNAMAK